MADRSLCTWFPFPPLHPLRLSSVWAAAERICFGVPLPKSTPASLAPQKAVPDPHTHSIHLLHPLGSPARVLTDAARGRQKSKHLPRPVTLRISISDPSPFSGTLCSLAGTWEATGILNPSLVPKRLAWRRRHWEKRGSAHGGWADKHRLTAELASCRNCHSSVWRAGHGYIFGLICI